MIHAYSTPERCHRQDRRTREDQPPTGGSDGSPVNADSSEATLWIPSSGPWTASWTTWRKRGETDVDLDFAQIIQSLNLGIVILDRDLRIVFWNRWMEEHSRRRSADALGRGIMELFPELVGKGFNWKSQSVFKLGNYAFFSQHLHGHLIPLPLSRYLTADFEHMQQNAAMCPLRNERGEVQYLCVTIEDATDAVLYREKLERAKQELETMSLTDPLTGLPNRRHLMETLEKANTTLEEAFLIMERLRKTVASTPFLFEGKAVRLTVSVGLASNEGEETITLDAILSRADEALYRAKTLGRNRTGVSRPGRRMRKASYHDCGRNQRGTARIDPVCLDIPGDGRYGWTIGD